MTPPEITAVIPTYRRPKLLRRAIESILGQSYPHVRVIVSDNASGDETPEVVRSIAARDPRVRYHAQPENLGAVANFRWVMAAAETPWFSILSDDDFLLPGFYAHAAERLAAHPEARFLCGHVVQLDENTGTHHLTPGGDWAEGFYAAGSAAARMLEHHFCWAGCVWSAGLRDAIGPLDDTRDGDVLYAVTAAALAPFVVSRRACAVFAVTGANYSVRAGVAESAASAERLREKILALPNIPEADRARIGAIVDRNLRVAVNGIFRNALQDGRWDRFDEAAAFLAARGALSRGKRLRVALAARRNPPSVWLRAFRAVTAAQRRLRALRHSGWSTASAEEIAARFGSGAG